MMPLAASVWSRFAAYGFYQNALIAGAAVAVACAVLSVFIVYKRMAFIGQGITHAAFGGIGLALLLQLLVPAMRSGLARDAVVAAFCVATAVIIGRVTRRGGVSEDTAIGICLVAAMAIGIVLVELRAELFNRMVESGALDPRTPGYAPSFHEILFGNILSIPPADVWLACIEAVVVLALVLAFFKELVFFACDEEAAEVFGVRTGIVYYGLLVCIGVTIVVAMRLLGVILSSALLILPGAIAGFWSHRIERVVLVAAISAVVCVAAGLFLSIALEVLSTGPLIVLVMCLVFAASWAVSAVAGRRGQRTGEV